MNIWVILLIILILGGFGGSYWGGAGTYGYGLGGILIIVLIVLLVTGRL